MQNRDQTNHFEGLEEASAGDGDVPVQTTGTSAVAAFTNEQAPKRRRGSPK